MEFPPSWRIDPLTEYEVALPEVTASTAAYTMELMAQLRPSGRILDGFRVALDGALPLQREVDMATIIPSATFRGYRLQLQYWTRDINIRRNTLTTAWQDVPELVAANDTVVLDATGAGVSPGEFQRLLQASDEEDPDSAAIRWAIIVGEDGNPRLQLQSLPCDAATLAGKPFFKG